MPSLITSAAASWVWSNPGRSAEQLVRLVCCGKSLWTTLVLEEGSFPNEFNFDDLDRLTIFADNLVPHVLRVDKILLYEEALAARIDAEQLIPARSPEEVEIRACAVHAVELMVKELRDSGHDVPAFALDYLLWNRGQQPYYKEVHPRHRTRTGLLLKMSAFPAGGRWCHHQPGGREAS